MDTYFVLVHRDRVAPEETILAVSSVRERLVSLAAFKKAAYEGTHTELAILTFAEGLEGPVLDQVTFTCDNTGG